MPLFTYVQYNSYRTSFLQCRTVFEQDIVWSKEDVLYKRRNKILDVDGFIIMCGYAVKIGETFDPENELYDEFNKNPFVRPQILIKIGKPFDPSKELAETNNK